MRINIEDSLWIDPRFQDLMIKVGRHSAKGMILELWTIAQKFWISSGGKGIPKPAWKEYGLPQELLDCRLARDDGDFVYAIGSKEQFAWLNQRSEAGRENKGKSNERRRTESNGRKRVRSSSSFSSSFSSSDSSSNSKKESAAPSANAGAFIASYCSAWKAKYGTRPEITGKEQGIAKRLAGSIGTERASELIASYLLMQDRWFQQKRHDMATFEQNLNAVVQFHDTGQTIPPDNSAYRREEGNRYALEQALKAIGEGDEQTG